MADRFAVFVRDDKSCIGKPPSVRLVLYALAARADAKGLCWPSVEQLVIDTGLSRATIFRALKEVRKVLTIDAPGYKHSNSYIFPWRDSLTPARERLKRGSEDNHVDKDRHGAECSQNVDNDDGFVDRQSHGEIVGNGGCRTVRRVGSHGDTGRCITVRSEGEREDKQEVSLSLTPSKSGGESHDETASEEVINTYDGTTKPKTKDDLKRIRHWCWYAGLDKDHTDEFMRINRVSHWKLVCDTYTVADLINDALSKWRHDNPSEYYDYQMEIKRSRKVG